MRPIIKFTLGFLIPIAMLCCLVFFLMRGNDNEVFPKNVNFKYNEFLESSVFFKGHYDVICVLPAYANQAYPIDLYKINEKIKNKKTWKFMLPSDGDWKIILSNKNSDDVDVYSISGGYVVYKNNFEKFNKDEYFIKNKFSRDIVLNEQCFLFQGSGFFVVDRPLGDLFFFVRKHGAL